MNQVYRKQFRQDYSRSKALNIFDYIPWTKLLDQYPQQFFLQVCMKLPLEYLRKGVLLHVIENYFYVPAIVLYEMQNNQVYKHLLEKLSNLFMDIPWVIFWDCQTSGNIFNKISMQYWSGKYLILGESKIQKLMSGSYHLNMFNRLKGLTILSDPITNKGIKQLMNINMKHLELLKLFNIGCTSDVIRLLKKKEKPKYRYLEIRYQQKFDYILLYKQLMHFKVFDNYQMRVGMRFYEPNKQIVYVGCLSKVIGEQYLRVILNSIIKFDDVVKNLMLSAKTISNLSESIFWE